MSTRGLYTFIDNDGQYHVYVHSDNYPDGEHGGVNKINRTLAKAWPLPRFEADEFATAFIATVKDGPGGVRLTLGETWQKAAPADIEYHYVVSMKGSALYVEVYSTNCWEKPTQKLVKKGTLGTVLTWAMKPEKV